MTEVRFFFFFFAGKEVVNCLNDGMVDDWDVFDNLLDYSYRNCLCTDPRHHPVLFTEPSWNDPSKRERLAELMFEKYDVPAMFVSNNAVLAAFSNGRYTGTVVDSGATHTTVTPVYNGFAITSAVVKSPLGGDYITAKCKEYFVVSSCSYKWLLSPSARQSLSTFSSVLFRNNKSTSSRAT